MIILFHDCIHNALHHIFGSFLFLSYYLIFYLLLLRILYQRIFLLEVFLVSMLFLLFDNIIINISSLVDKYIDISVPSVIILVIYKLVAITEKPHCGITPNNEPMIGPIFLIW